ncbi:hypothetical protein POM88_009014 [Heracleum sosnowskyi]|uniref:Uncharacterized protein n=1 Tax=Heracleum sosnowskyi TaxID=360622 RepID=A0AAD8N7Y8_9APIA|nr:hypothetical protein POM88_009014 [Heracleum sosnowskyi]
MKAELCFVTEEKAFLVRKIADSERFLQIACGILNKKISPRHKKFQKHILVELASSRDGELPTLIYEARPVVSRGNQGGRSALGMLVGGVSDSESVEVEMVARGEGSRNRNSGEE